MPYFVWEPSAPALRAIPRLQARQILIALNQHVRSMKGDVAFMKGKPAGRLRLRCGDYRVIFRRSDAGKFQILKVGHRREIYRED